MPGGWRGRWIRFHKFRFELLGRIPNGAEMDGRTFDEIAQKRQKEAA